MIKYLCIIAVYYGFPVLFSDTGGFITYLLIIAPICSFICALFPSMKYGYELLFPIMCGVLFIPSALLYFNETAFIYAIVYAACAFFGSVLGGRLKANFLNEKKSNN
ncbi:MAG: hypothetical protein IJ356_02275 [Erysipelotrichaceae bacterium]|nr:hypothetical protein [Erysipelotrichaceae bacterium]